MNEVERAFQDGFVKGGVRRLGWGNVFCLSGLFC